MAIPLTQLFARFGTELSPDQRLEFVHQIIASNHPSSCEAWEFLWREKILTFDRSQADDALHRFLGSPASDSIIRSALTLNPDSNLAFALVPGCGRGDDAVALASLGFNTWGVDISPTAIDYAIAGTSEQADSAGNLGTVTFMALDFFALDPPLTKFCLIYDTMFFCSLAPILRDRWATTMCRLMRPGGYLVISISLTNPCHDSKGPPYSVDLGMISEKLRGSAEVAPWSLVYPCTSDPIGDGNMQMIAVWKKISTE